ncbi:hypothetical protein E2562_022720 [Oryza meyeriana var. granulata]|uniref:Uncharacterized protein n=1 Tax=Oryza meyeriana var. granulata TaxID=110450 RepID=A0A6G1E2J1_9ORYZ|nr:hypothetical protein E2562_022720 [Oryza meyeriana var. granulata]
MEHISSRIACRQHAPRSASPKEAVSSAVVNMRSSSSTLGASPGGEAGPMMASMARNRSGASSS